MTKVTTVEQVKEKVDSKVIFEGGPTDKQLQEWKEKYRNKVYSISLTARDTFIWRTLSRKEFKELNALQVDPLVKEESLCEICILWPDNYTFEEIENGIAGAPSILAEHIMETSGFNVNSTPVAL